MSNASPAPAPRPARPLWHKLAALILLFALIPASAIGLSLLDSNAEMVKAVSREVRLSATEASIGPLEALGADTLAALAAVGQALGDPQIAPENRLDVARTLVSSSRVIDHATLYDAAGDKIDTIHLQGGEQVAAGALPKLSPEITSQSASQGRFIAPRRDAMKRLLFVVPLRTPQGELTGHVATRLSFAPLEQRVEAIAQEKFPNDDNGLFVVSAAGEPLIGERSEALSAAIKARVAELAALPGVATTEELELGGEARLVTFKPLVDLPWVVVASVPREVAYAPLERMRLLVILALVIATLLSIGCALLFARTLTRPIDALVTQCEALARRQFERRVTVNTRDELALLGHTLNESARHLAESEEEIRRQERIRQDLGRYLPQELVERVVTDGSLDRLSGQQAQITVLFADVVGFTRLCATLEPEQTVALLNELFTIITEIIFRHGGVVDKFVGDCVMAFWGAPHPEQDHAVEACSAAEEILSWLELGNVAWREQLGVELELAIGIHSGEAIVGNVGSSTRLTYTAIGQTINLAARLEAIARPNQILTTRATAALVDDLFDVAYIGDRQMPGEEAPVEVFELKI